MLLFLLLSKYFLSGVCGAAIGEDNSVNFVINVNLHEFLFTVDNAQLHIMHTLM